jgi:hypothetical protein
VPVMSSISEPSLDNAQMQVYPNPARDKVVCRISSTELTLVSAQLFDMLGENIAVPVSKSADNSLLISVEDVSNGMYVIQARDSRGVLHQNKISIFK